MKGSPWCFVSAAVISVYAGSVGDPENRGFCKGVTNVERNDIYESHPLGHSIYSVPQV